MVSFLFSYRGRINRAQYWLGSIGVGVAGAVLMLLLGALAPQPAVDKTGAGVIQALTVMAFVAVPVWLLMAWCGLALQVKRFHDRGRSGLWTLLPLVPMALMMVSLVSGILSGQQPMQVAASIQLYLLLLFLINLGFFIDLGCLPGKPEANKYGDPPGSGGSYTPAPQAPAAPSAAAPATTMSSLFGAQTAMERAIAEQQARPQPAPRPAMASAGAAPAAAPSFGRKSR